MCSVHWHVSSSHCCLNSMSGDTCMCSPLHTLTVGFTLWLQIHTFTFLCVTFMCSLTSLCSCSHQSAERVDCASLSYFSWVLTSLLGTTFGDTAVDMLSLEKPGSGLLINSISHSRASDKHKVGLQQKRHGSLKPLIWRYPHISICFCKRILGRIKHSKWHFHLKFHHHSRSPTSC